MRPRTSPAPTGPAVGRAPVFDRVLVGIDSTDESLVAAAQAGVLRAPAGTLMLLAAVDRLLATHAGLLARHAEDALVARTSTELARACELVDADAAELVSGRLVDVLREQCAGHGTTLVAVGCRPHRRLAALTFGGHDIDAVHDLPCSVLVARPGWGPAHPAGIVVGVDGSPESLAAEAAARSLGARLRCDVVPAVGLGDDVDLAVLRAERDEALLHPGSLLDAVVSASSPRSLIVIGRAVRHDRRLGADLAERVVAAAACSVLVVTHDAGDGSVAAHG